MPVAPPIFGSTGSTTIVLASALVVVGVAMVCAAVWLIGATRSDSRSLGPLEVMGTWGWRRRDAAGRSKELDEARPEGAPLPAPILERDPDDPAPLEPAAAVEPVDRDQPAEVDQPAEPVDQPVARASSVDESISQAHLVDEPQPAERP